MQDITIENNIIHRHHAKETHRVEAWGRNSVRVRISMNPDFSDRLSVLLPPAPTEVETTESEKLVTLRNGKLLVEMDITGRLIFRHAETGRLLFDEVRLNNPSRHRLGRQFRPLGSREFATSLEFYSHRGERFYGLGEHANGLLDQKGCVHELLHHNTNFNVPFAVSNRMYGFFWNCPAVGTVELAANRTRWTADRAEQIDYWVTAGDSYAEIMECYAEATGKPPMLPEWAAGFWQSKLRYKTQQEVLEVAREHVSRGLPLDVIVIDFMHWTHNGEWKMDLEAFPDLRALNKELAGMGIRTLISFHPFVSRFSETYQPLLAGGMLIQNERSGNNWQTDMPDRPGERPSAAYVIDSTNPATRNYVWERAKAGYFDFGTKVFWLDSTEPGTYNYPDQLRFHLGNGEAMISLFPYCHAMGFHEGLRAAGETEIFTLCRAAYAGSQRFGAAVWSGDIDATFEEFRNQITAGLNVSMSGIPWWHTDTGGFNRHKADEKIHAELLVRWFQYSVFTPILRRHGNDYDTEIWKESPEVSAILKDYLLLRYRLRPYILEQMRLAHEKGTPPMRPMFFDFPNDEKAYEPEDAFLLGPDLLVAPVGEQGALSRDVYLPEGARWVNVWTGEEIEGGRSVCADAPLNRIPVFARSGSEVIGCFKDSQAMTALDSAKSPVATGSTAKPAGA
ncbi:MAG: glycoside hydrolase family 31 protein [Spartobacteria bacterium]